MTIYKSRIITVSIDRDWREVYDFASIPENFQRWAAGLGRRFERSGEEWTAEDPEAGSSASASPGQTNMVSSITSSLPRARKPAMRCAWFLTVPARRSCSCC